MTSGFAFQQNSIVHWPELLRWLTLFIEVPKLSRRAIINGVPFGCPDQDDEQAGVRKNGAGGNPNCPDAKRRSSTNRLLDRFRNRFVLPAETEDVISRFARLGGGPKDKFRVIIHALQP